MKAQLLVIALGVLTHACSEQRGDKKSIEQTVDDKGLPEFALDPRVEGITSNSATVIFSVKETSEVSISVQDNLNLSLSHSEIESSPNVIAVSSSAFETSRISLIELNPFTAYNVHITVKDGSGNLLRAPYVLNFMSKPSGSDLDLAGQPLPFKQGVDWAFSPDNLSMDCNLELINAPFWLEVSDDGTTIVGVPQVSSSAAITLVIRGGGPGCDRDTTFTVDVKSDPLEAYAWHLNPQSSRTLSWFSSALIVDSRVHEATRLGLTGKGIHVTLVDSGTQINHPDLIDNIELERNFNLDPLVDFGCEICDRLDTSAPVTPGSPADQGTTIAGIIAARGWNGLGSRGVAPEVKLSTYNLSAVRFERVSENDVTRIFTFDTDVICHSAAADKDILQELPDFNLDNYSRAQRSKINVGRNGKGIIFVKAAGDFNDNAAVDQSNVTPWEMIIGSHNTDGKKSRLSNSGANLWIAAPGGELGYQSDFNAAIEEVSETLSPRDFYAGIIGPDIFDPESKCTAGAAKFPRHFGNAADLALKLFSLGRSSGFNLGWHPDNRDCQYTASVANTAAATGIVSGVVALLLEANPSLSWRDIKFVLATSAQEIDPNFQSVITTVKGRPFEKVQPWIRNAAGFNFHNWYGFGALDVRRALEIAIRDYQPLPALFDSNWGFVSSPNTRIPSANLSGAFSEYFQIQDKILESVQVRLTIRHPNVSSLSIELVSPQGTKSILKSMNDGLSQRDLEEFVFLSNAYYGENSRGRWQLRVIDGKPQDRDGRLVQWYMRITGHTPGVR